MTNIENIRKWVTALRSGEYEQTKGVLKNDNGFCCLGVATDVYMKECGGTWSKSAQFFGNEPNPRSGYLFDDYEGERLPREVRDWLGIQDADPELLTGRSGEYEPHLPATSLNDEEEWTFEQIAQAIKETYDV